MAAQVDVPVSMLLVLSSKLSPRAALGAHHVAYQGTHHICCNEHAVRRHSRHTCTASAFQAAAPIPALAMRAYGIQLLYTWACAGVSYAGLFSFAAPEGYILTYCRHLTRVDTSTAAISPG